MTTSSKLALSEAGMALAWFLAAFAVFGPLLFMPAAKAQAPVRHPVVGDIVHFHGYGIGGGGNAHIGSMVTAVDENDPTEVYLTSLPPYGSLAVRYPDVPEDQTATHAYSWHWLESGDPR